MNATDVGDSRFEEARAAAREIIDTLGRDDSITLVEVGSTPEVLATAETNRARLRDALAEAEPGQTEADWNAALTLAAGGARGVEDFSIVIITDGGLPQNLPSVPGEIDLITVGEAAQNVALSALAARTLNDAPQLFAQMTNYGNRETEVIFSIALDGELYSAQRYTIPAQQRVDITLEDLPTNFSDLTASVSPPAASTVPDHLAEDDEAYLVYNASGVRQVLLMTPRNIFLQQAFSSQPGVEVTQADPEQGLPRGNFDLVVLDGWLPGRLPETDVLIINPPGSIAQFEVTGTLQDPNQALVTQVASGDERTRFVDFNTVNIRQFQQISGYESWGEALIMARGGPLLVAGAIEDRQIAVLSFALQDSDLPLQIAYPILMANLMQWYTPPSILNLEGSVTPGAPIIIRPFEGETVRLTLPNGETQGLPIGDNPQVIFADTAQPGIYTAEVLQGDEVLARERFAVNLFSRLESDLTPRGSITIGTTTISEAAREEVGQREFWRWLVVLGLLLLAIEWLIYHRRKIWKRQVTLPGFQPSLASAQGRRPGGPR
ncbi:MAG: VWA domain-containing protein [Anaerolineae bacterium]|nr:VWA domain-containing protein [Anaerolineae bacterium]